MVSLREVHTQLKRIGYNFNFWMRREIIELSRVLDTDETVKQCVNGYYQGGFAVLAATNQRLILIDRKPLFLTLEVIWYDKIGQIDYNHRLLNANICISTPNKDLMFTSYNNPHLRQLLVYTQEKMAEANKAIMGQHEASRQGEERLEPTLPGSSPLPQAQTQALTPMQTVLMSRSHHLPIPNMAVRPPTPYELTLYAATRLPFSRRRYFARQPQGS